MIKAPNAKAKCSLLMLLVANKDEELIAEGKGDFNRFWSKMSRSLGNT